jgi:hypothetical protein
MTVVEVKTEMEAMKPLRRQRKVIGVAETAEILLTPELSSANVSDETGPLFPSSANSFMFSSPKQPQSRKVTVSYSGISFDVTFIIVAPSGFVVRGVTCKNNGILGEAGNFSAEIAYYPLPTTVSFVNLEFVEVGMIAVDATGYFADSSMSSMLNHSLHGANKWIKLSDYDDYFIDEIAMPLLPKPWGDGGAFTWPIPVGWRCWGENSGANIICNHNQRFELTSEGTTRIMKMGCVAERGTNEYLKVTRSQ